MSYIFPTKAQVGLGNADNTSDINKPVSTAQGVAIAATSVIQIASAIGVDGTALASTILTFGSGLSLSTHIPLFYIFKFTSGTLGISVAKIKNSVVDLTSTCALVSLTSTQEIYTGNIIPPTTTASIMPNSGDLSVQVTTAGLGASTFNVYAYGILRP